MNMCRTRPIATPISKSEAGKSMVCQLRSLLVQGRGRLYDNDNVGMSIRSRLGIENWHKETQQ